MSRYGALKQIILEHRLRLFITYCLFSLEMLGSLLRPFFLGEAVNDLVKGSYHGLLMLSIVHLLWLIIGTIRHRYDTRTYSAIYTELVTGLLSRRFGTAQVSKLSAHSNLAREFIDFLEYDLVYIFEAVYSILGSLALLFFYEPSVVWICLSILLPVMIASYFYAKKVEKLNRLKNDELEKQVDIIASGNQLSIRRHYNSLRTWQIRISDQEAWNFGIMEIFVITVITVSLLITHNQIGTAILAGDLIGIYNYILKFVSGLDTIPYTVQRLAALKDISRRMELAQEGLAEEEGRLEIMPAPNKVLA